MTKDRGIKTTDALMRQLVQVPKSELPPAKQSAKKRKASKKNKK